MVFRWLVAGLLAVVSSFVSAAPPAGYVLGGSNRVAAVFACAPGASVWFEEEGNSPASSGQIGPCPASGSYTCGAAYSGSSSYDFNAYGECWYFGSDPGVQNPPVVPGAVGVTVVIPGLTLSAEDGALVSAAVVSVWLVGFGFSALVRVLRSDEGSPD